MITPLQLAVEYGAQPCVRSGFCCKQAACGFGEYDQAGGQCKHLGRDDAGQYTCLIAEQIVQDPTWVISPAFGAGCCSTMNTDRQEILRSRR